MIYFALPGFYSLFNLNTKLLQLKQDNPEVFQEDTDFAAVFDNFQFCIFDGGRIFPYYKQANKEEIEHIIDVYNNNFNIPMRLVYTSSVLSPEHYQNRFGNLCLRLCENEINEIVVNDPKFEQYIREKYPKFSFISSTTKCLNQWDSFITELAKDDYKMVCLDYNLNKNKKLFSLTQPEKEKCEFLVNAICSPGCPQRKGHYRLNSIFYLNYGKPYQMKDCPLSTGINHPNVLSSINNLTPEEIHNIYYPAGFQYFKLEGRTLSKIEMAHQYVYYLIKQEYQLDIADFLINDDKQVR